MSLTEGRIFTQVWLAMSQAPWGLGSSRKAHLSACPQSVQWGRLVEAPHLNPRRTSSPWGLYFSILDGHRWSLWFWSHWSLTRTLKPLCFPLLVLPSPGLISHMISTSTFASAGAAASQYGPSPCVIYRGAAGFVLSLISTETTFALGIGEPEWMEESKINSMQS